MTTTTTSSATATTTTDVATATTPSTTTTTAWSNILLNNLPHLDNSQADYHPPPQVCPLHPSPPSPDFHVILGPLNTTASRVISKFVLIELQREGRTVLTGLIKDNPPLKAPTYQSL